MNHDDLRLTIIIGRGYGDTFHKIENKPVTAAIRELYTLLSEKYDVNIRSILSSRFVRQSSRAFLPAGPCRARYICSDGLSSPGVVSSGPGGNIRRSKLSCKRWSLKNE